MAEEYYLARWRTIRGVAINPKRCKMRGTVRLRAMPSARQVTEARGREPTWRGRKGLRGPDLSVRRSILSVWFVFGRKHRGLHRNR